MIKTEEALAMIGGHVDEELLLRNEYLAIENEILRKKIQGQVKLSQCERIRLATVGKKIGIKALRDVAMIVKPETILTWYRKLIASKFDSSKNRKKKVGRPVRSKYYFDKLTYDISCLDSKFLKKAICSIFTSLSCFILVT